MSRVESEPRPVLLRLGKGQAAVDGDARIGLVVAATVERMGLGNLDVPADAHWCLNSCARESGAFPLSQDPVLRREFPVTDTAPCLLQGTATAFPRFGCEEGFQRSCFCGHGRFLQAGWSI